VLLLLSKLAPKPWFFSNIKPYWNRGFRLSIDGFGFSVQCSFRVRIVPWTLIAFIRHGTANGLCAKGVISSDESWNRQRRDGGWGGLRHLNEWKSVGTGEGRRWHPLDITISVTLSLSEAVFAKYSPPLNGCIDSNYSSIFSWWRGVVGNAFRLKQSYSTPGPVSTAIGDCLRACKPFQCEACQLGRLSLLPSVGW